METHVVYCSACDRNVRVVFEGAPELPEAGGLAVDPSGVCVDFTSDACTGSMCALFDLPPAEMLVKLKASGLVPES
jgi:hypothetical protein